ncbi:hypothetical protein YUYDRAFT_07376 [Streptomyces sp. ScaeMP-e48]|uniref:hypothetical protein n=1 Tax=Streptomyces sp. ScaeMP-e48 TaxID=1100823 RepID=UPI000823D9EC|nr:hypothetical protein [Streptomyces sp. ScaeMP-e48]SCK55679.1 hypothetical protein YUYDRAFT_07376 [Streptomyces sp. ScaeMP-e48]
MQQQQPDPDRSTRIVVVLIGVAMVGFIAVTYPTLIPALTVALAAFMALAVVLKL